MSDFVDLRPFAKLSSAELADCIEADIVAVLVVSPDQWRSLQIAQDKGDPLPGVG